MGVYLYPAYRSPSTVYLLAMAASRSLLFFFALAFLLALAYGHNIKLEGETCNHYKVPAHAQICSDAHVLECADLKTEVWAVLPYTTLNGALYLHENHSHPK